MALFTLTHQINTNLENFWNVWFDKNLTEKFYREAQGYTEYTIVDQVESDEKICRKVFMRPKMNMPGPIIKILGTGAAFTEEGTFDKATKIMRWKRVPNTLADKIRFEGTLHTEVIDDTKTRCITEVMFEAKIFGVGGLMESSFEKQIREELDSYATYLNKLV